MPTDKEITEMVETVDFKDAPHLSSAMAKAVYEFMEDLFVHMSMPAWRLGISVETTGEREILANIHHHAGRHSAIMHLCEQWMDLDRTTQVDTLVHEAMHLWHFRIDNLINDSSSSMGIHAFTDLSQRYDKEVEYMVDQLAMFVSNTRTVSDSWKKMLRKHKVYAKQ